MVIRGQLEEGDHVTIEAAEGALEFAVEESA
jgi:hypothetical protein